MELWVRSTARANLIKVNFLTIMEGSNFYKKKEWEYEGYTIADAQGNKEYVLLGTYKTKERALEVLDEIQELLMPTSEYKQEIDKLVISYKNVDTVIYEMPKE